MKTWFVVMILGLLGYLLFWPVPIDPVAWQPAEAPALEGPYAENDRLASVERFAERLDAAGPEDIAIDAEGRIYSGYPDGAILRTTGPGAKLEPFANTGGRPLGMKFDAAGNLIVADADKGLLSVDAAGLVTVLSTEAGGGPYKFADDLDIARDGTIYFTDGSSRWGFDEVYNDIAEHAGHGRLLKYDPATGQATVLMANLNFANGVALDPNERFVLVNETGAYRVWRYWLRGPNAGESELWIDNLPGFPDNINAGTGGMFWLALFGPRNAQLDAMAPYPFLRKVALRLPESLRPHPPKIAFVLGMSAAGDVVYNLQDFSDDAWGPVTSATEHDGWLYLGSLTNTHMARIRRP